MGWAREYLAEVATGAGGYLLVAVGLFFAVPVCCEIGTRVVVLVVMCADWWAQLGELL